MMFVNIKTGQVNEHIFTVNAMMSNLFIIKYGDSTICIDTGVGKGLVARGLKKLGIDPEKVSHVFLTHSDTDHTGCIGLFSNAELYLSSKEEQMITRRTRRTKGSYNKPISREYKLLGEDDTIQIGEISVRGIETPGHTPGSMSYLVNGKYLFVGDTLSLNKDKAQTFPAFINMDTRTQMESIRKLAGLRNVKMMFTAHSGYTKDFESAMKAWLKEENT